jgi:cob(I)alamin adenosyltransferase
MKIYTKTGDRGQTSLLGGKRVDKSCLEIDAIGEIDELNGSIGQLISLLPKNADASREYLLNVQHTLFVIGANLAAVQTDLVNVPAMTEKNVSVLEDWIDSMEKDLTPLTQFILPGGHKAAAMSFFARAVCRRAERKAVELKKTYELRPLILEYLNRLSDALFVLGRYINKTSGKPDVLWKK